MIWLLDNNLPKRLASTLRGYDIDCATARSRGWAQKTNGELVEVVAIAGFSCILTRDKKFQESVARALKKHPSLCIVLLTLAQAPSRIYLESFSKLWIVKPIVPISGQLILWG